MSCTHKQMWGIPEFRLDLQSHIRRQSGGPLALPAICGWPTHPPYRDSRDDVRRGHPANPYSWTAGRRDWKAGNETALRLPSESRRADCPRAKSVVERIRSSPDGWLWIETDKGAIRAWDVFDERGYYMGRVASPVPIEKEPFPVFGRGTVTGVTRDELGVQYVVRLRLGR